MQYSLIARQPIYDARLEINAYELLFRSEEALDRADVIDGDHATSQVLLNLATEIGLDALVGTRPAFVNITRAFLTGELPLPPLEGRLALEILETVTPDAATIAGARAMRERGYTIVLDDFVYSEATRPLVELAHIVKLDLMALGETRLREHVALLRPYGVELLAEKVETQAEFEMCRELGFHYFQGYFFCRPNLVRERRLPASRLAILRLMAELQNSGEVAQLEAVITQDVALSYRVLRFINAAQFGMTKRVDSLHRALILLGTEKVRQLATLMLLAAVDDKPRALVGIALTRAKMCEELGAAMKRPDLMPALFSVGLLSVLDAFMDRPMAEILEQLPLEEAVSAALRERSGELGAVLGCALAYEQADWADARLPGVLPSAISAAYMNAVAWADQTVGTLAG